uniref:Nitrilase 1 n=1 Tax=Neogobius melanostomus TaxID=47308 RepID=A0A8C6WXB5_9GOBI
SMCNKCRKVRSSTTTLGYLIEIIIRLNILMSTAPDPVAAVCQMTATPDKEANLSVCKNLVEEAKQKGASMVFLPEGFDYIGSNREETLSLAESLEGETISSLAQIARKLEIWLSLGGFHEQGPNWKTDRRIITSIIYYICDISSFLRDIVSVYRKAHLFDVELPEKGVSLKESWIGHCYDLRFPELSLALQRQGAEILTYPSAFTVATGAAHWEVLLRAPAQVGPHHDKRSSYGHALAVDPWGVVLGDCGGEQPGLIMVDINLEKLRNTRRNMPVQEHRRKTDFYHSLEKT